MYIYRGKLDWYNYAQNEGITVIVPVIFRPGDPVNLAYQWTVDAAGQHKVNNYPTGPIDSTAPAKGEFWFFGEQYYRFQGTLPKDLKSLSLVMSNPRGDTSSPMNLNLVYNRQIQSVSRPRIYVGKLNWFDYAVNEMFVVVVPDTLEVSAPLCAFWQWTVDASGNKKPNVDLLDTIRTVEQTAAGLKITFTTGYYEFSGLLDVDRTNMLVTMKNPQGDTRGPFDLLLKSP